MSTSTVLGYAAKSVGNSLEPIVYDSPELGENDVKVAITHCGVCYTDIQAIEDYYGITKYPFIPGHEIVGSVTELGNSVTTLNIGDRVGIGWQGRSCGHCEWCRQGEVQLCQDIANASSMEPYGGFSSSITIDSRFAYRLPDRLPSEYAAVLMCAGLSVFNPLRKYASQIPQKIGIVGLGGLGHLAIQFAHHLNYEVTVISTSPDKKAEAKLRRWICACDEMQIYKYCHCLLFVREDGLPITEYLPEDHEGRKTYGLVTDPTPGKGRALRHHAPKEPPTP